MSQEVYAAVLNGRITEFPVTLEVIKSRGHSPYNYVPVRFENKPEGYDTETMYVTRSLELKEREVVVKWTLSPMSFSVFLATLKQTSGAAKDGQAITESQYAALQRYGEVRLRARLDMLAQAHGYESFESCLNRFSNSTVPEYKAEAAFLQLAYDTGWQDLVAFIQKLKTNQAVVPVTPEAFDQALPILAWNPVIAPVVTSEPTPQPEPTTGSLIDVGTSPLG